MRAFRAWQPIGALCGAAAAFLCFAKESPTDDYALLRRIPTPDALFGPYLPRAYQAPVTLSGEPADQMRRSLEAMGLPAPQYEEMRTPSGAFSLALANSDYPLETRDLVSGILNPTDMMDAIVSQVLRYRDTERFDQMKKETALARTPDRINGQPVYRVHITPRGKRFNYLYEDQGAFLQETWLTGVDCVLDSASGRILELAILKHSRQTRADAAEPPPEDSSLQRYRFGYIQIDKAVLPCSLSVFSKDRHLVTISASYRRERKYLVFDSRIICCDIAGQGQSCLHMSYGKYRFGNARAPAGGSLKPNTYAKKLAKAASLSRKAAGEIAGGKLSPAMRTLHTLISECPETPQAIEARRLLSALP